MVLIAMMAAVLAIMAQITIPIGAVPFSMSVFGVFLAGAVLPPLSAAACVGVYLFLGCVGLPVFAQFRAGPQVLFGPTGGFLLGYFALALAVSVAIRLGANMWVQCAAALLGLAVMYMCGTLWFMLLMDAGFAQALAMCVAPFVLFDVVKGAVALLLARALRRRLAVGRVSG